MPEFVCRVASPDGEVFDKTYVGTDEKAVRRDLETQDLLILDVKRRNPWLHNLLRIELYPENFHRFANIFNVLLAHGDELTP